MEEYTKTQTSEKDFIKRHIGPSKEDQSKMLKELKNAHATFHIVSGSPISEKLLEFQRLYGFPLKKYNQIRHSSHTLTNFV